MLHTINQLLLQNSALKNTYGSALSVFTLKDFLSSNKNIQSSAERRTVNLILQHQSS